MEKKCIICNSSNFKKIINWTPPYKIYWCKNCDLIFSHPLPTERKLTEFYDGFLFGKNRLSNSKIWLALIEQELQRIFDIESNRDKGKTFLDFGGGIGFQTVAAKNLGLNAFYYELDKEAKKFFKKKFNFENSIIDNRKELKKRRYHYILADNVIEHVSDPISFINSLYSLLHRNGILIIKTPNSRNIELIFYSNLIFPLLKKAKTFNTFIDTIKSFIFRFWSCDPPIHLYAFSKKSLIKILFKLKITKYNFSYYHIPFFQYLDTFKNIYFIFNLFLKIFQFLLLKLKLLSPGGITLRIEKN
jgi:2-polyprenyl-3-methyl-5-hydroxy-6-metoxy-1,4-benzoquinol methylase